MCSNQIQERKVGYNVTVCEKTNRYGIRLIESIELENQILKKKVLSCRLFGKMKLHKN